MKLRTYTVLLFLLLTIIRPAWAETLLVVGDSLSAAYGIPEEQGWIALLRQALATEGHDIRIVNASISGDTTANALVRLPQALQSHRPDIVIIALGGNDGLRAMSLAEMKQNLAAMIDRVRADGRRVLLVGVELPPNYGRRFTRRFKDIYRQLSVEKTVPLVPSMVDDIGIHPELMQADGIHPNAQAQPLIADKVLSGLLPLLTAGDGNHTGRKGDDSQPVEAPAG